MTDSEAYDYSLYESIKVIKENEFQRVEIVVNSLDSRQYIRKTYFSDKREVFNVINRIDSPYLAGIKQVFYTGDTIIIEEFVEGVKLSEMINGISVNEPGKIINCLLNATKILHENGIIHRDIKPDNILIRPNGNAVLIDYGIARVFDPSKAQDTEKYGTIGYAPPEQYGYSQSDFKSDIYAIGKTIEEIGKACGLSTRISKVAKKCTAFNPDDRFHDIDEIQRAIKSNKRNIGVLIAALILIVGGGLILITYKWAAKEEKSETIEGINYDQLSLTGSRMLYCQGPESINCIPILAEEQKNEVTINGETICLEAYHSGDELQLVINGFEFRFQFTCTNKDYEDTHSIAEIIFYDLDLDGVDEIIPLLADGKYIVEEDYYLLNGTGAWCIYRDESGNYCLAEGEMTAYFSPLTIYETDKNIIYGDIPTYFKLTDGEIKSY